jgi:hypothetical protein
VFRKEHTVREIAHYIVDFDAPDLTLDVKLVHHVLKFGWTITNIVTTLVSCLVLILMSMPEFFSEEADAGNVTLDWLGLTELGCVLFFTADYFIRLRLTQFTALQFVFDPHNLIDLFTTVPYFIQVVLAANGVSVEALRVMFLLRTFRIIKLARYHPGLQIVLQTLTSTADLLALFLFVILVIIILSGTGFYYAETWYDADRGLRVRLCPEYKKWATGNNCHIETSPHQSIFDAMYWATVTVTTVGYRSETPSSPLGKVIAVATAIVGILFFAAPATVLSTNYKMLRRQAAAAMAFKKMDMRTTAAMKAQEDLKKQLLLADRHRFGNGRVKIRSKRVLREVCTFTYGGVTRPLYEVTAENYYVYPPICTVDRDEDGAVLWTDDFNPTTAQRTLTLLLVLDTDDAREAARAALVGAGALSGAATENEALVCADPLTHLDLAHDFTSAYPDLDAIVILDQLENPQGSMQDLVPVRFVISRPHIYPSVNTVQLLRETKLVVTLLTRMVIDEMDVPLVVDIIMASRFVRELSEIAMLRPSDHALIAYIHTSDAAELLTGFAEQFIPTPDDETLLMDGYIVDHQVLLCMMSSFPTVRLNMLPAAAANSFYRGQHLSVDLSEEMLLEVNLTALAAFDDLGFGNRFRLQAPVCKCQRTDVQFQLV